MGDKFYHRLEIGGDPGEHRDELIKIIMDPALCPEYTKPFVSEHLTVSYCDCPVDWVDGVKCKLREMQLPFNHYDRRNEDCNEHLACWRPGDIEELSFPLFDDQPAVLLPELVYCLETHGMTLVQVIEKYTPPELPPYVSDGTELTAGTPEPEPPAVTVTVEDDAPTPMTKKALLTLLREEFQDEFDFGGKTWWRNDLAEQLEMTPEQLFDRDNDTGLLFELKEDGELSADWRQCDGGSYDYLVSLKGLRIEWD